MSWEEDIREMKKQKCQNRSWAFTYYPFACGDERSLMIKHKLNNLKHVVREKSDGKKSRKYYIVEGDPFELEMFNNMMNALRATHIESLFGRPKFNEIEISNHGIRYYAMQMEQCPVTKRLHWQGWIQFVHHKTFRQVKDIFASNMAGAHLEALKTTTEWLDNYCRKFETSIANTHYQWGKFESQGKSSGRAEMITECVRKPMSELKDQGYDAIMVTCYNGIRERRKQLGTEDCIEHRDWQTELKIWCGEPNSGKTTSMLKYAKHLARLKKWRIYEKQVGNDTWTGYNGQEIVICNDWYNLGFGDKLELNLHKWKTYVDLAGTWVRPLYGQVPFLARIILMTCNTDPIHWFDGFDENNIKAWKRRLHEIIECKFDPEYKKKQDEVKLQIDNIDNILSNENIILDSSLILNDSKTYVKTPITIIDAELADIPDLL